MPRLTIQAGNAAQILEWIKHRNGVAVWRSINLSNPSGQWLTPATQQDGSPALKPTWQAANTPEVIIDPSEISVETSAEVKRFHIAIRRSSNGLSLKLTEASSARVRREAEKVNGFYQFDYSTQEAVIFRPVSTVPLTQYDKGE